MITENSYDDGDDDDMMNVAHELIKHSHSL